MRKRERERKGGIEGVCERKISPVARCPPPHTHKQNRIRGEVLRSVVPTWR